MNPKFKDEYPDFKGIGYSKIGYFKETRSKIKELESLNIELARRHNKLEAIFNSISDSLTILDRNCGRCLSMVARLFRLPAMNVK